MRQPRVALVGAYLALAGGLLTSAASPSSAADRSATTLYRLSGISADATDDAWAVGFTKTDERFNTLVDHWDGTHWSQVPSRNPSPHQVNVLAAVSAVSPSDVWAVGYHGAFSPRDGGLTTLVEHWDGATWTTVASPNGPDGAGSRLTSVSAISAGNVWAVGYYRDGNKPHRPLTLVEHWDGNSWTTVPSTNPGVDRNLLYGVSAASPSTVVAVGRYDDTSLVEEWDGAGFNDVFAPQTSTVLNAVDAISATDAWAVGETATSHFDGATWTQVASPGIGDLRSVSGDATDDVWAAAGLGPVEHWDGISWKGVVGPRSRVRGLSALSPTDVWAVGYTGRLAAIQHWDGKTWTKAGVS